VFFSGFATFTSYNFLITAFVLVFSLIIILSFFNSHPLGGAVIGVFVGGSFLLGHLVFAIIYVNSFSSVYENNLLQYMSIDPAVGRLPSILSAMLALTSLGFLAGLLGYVLKKLSPVSSEGSALIFRDYWSQIHGWKKSRNREYRDIDRKLAGWSLLKGSWIQLLKKKIMDPRQELLFLPKATSKDDKFSKGDLYDISSNKVVGEFVDYNELISKYRPMLIHDPDETLNLALPKNFRSILSPAFERLVSKTIDNIVESRKIILVYLSFFLLLVFGIIIYGVLYPYFDIVLTVAAVMIPSGIPLILAILFWRKSKNLIKKRPDESVLLFSIYLCLLLVYPILVWILFHRPSPFQYWIPSEWAQQWFWGWTIPLLIVSGILGFGYIFIHRETENVNTYFFNNSSQEKESFETKPFNKPEDITWISSDKQTEFFWVIRFMYYWRFEFTLPLPHYDWERVELWIDAKSGVLKWIVSDYHYRELWYKIKDPVEEPLPDIYVKILPNFHTPIPITDYDEALEYKSFFDVSKMQLLKNIFSGIFGKARKETNSQEEITHSNKKNHYQKLIREQGQGLIADCLAKIPYEEMRYVYGVDSISPDKNEMRYKTSKSTD
jgi:hypothetical protein